MSDEILSVKLNHFKTNGLIRMSLTQLRQDFKTKSYYVEEDVAVNDKSFKPIKTFVVFKDRENYIAYQPSNRKYILGLSEYIPIENKRLSILETIITSVLDTIQHSLVAEVQGIDFVGLLNTDDVLYVVFLLKGVYHGTNNIENMDIIIRDDLKQEFENFDELSQEIIKELLLIEKE